MQANWKTLGIGVVSFAVLVLISTASWALTKRDLRRQDSRGAVSVTVTYLNPLGKVRGDTLDFEVRMNTHSVDLDGFAVEKLAVLRGLEGGEVRSLGWFDPGGGGHHRFGILRFPLKDASGKLLLPGGKGTVELRIRGIADPATRVFQWKVPLPSKTAAK
ncbi:hypothetical protein ACFLQ0_01780 [Nitrospinota bacterium]